ncbi:hypothetical protein PT2222_80034 [Paraburkholderia tropica]
MLIERRAHAVAGRDTAMAVGERVGPRAAHALPDHHALAFLRPEAEFAAVVSEHACEPALQMRRGIEHIAAYGVVVDHEQMTARAARERRLQLGEQRGHQLGAERIEQEHDGVARRQREIGDIGRNRANRRTMREAPRDRDGVLVGGLDEFGTDVATENARERILGRDHQRTPLAAADVDEGVARDVAERVERAPDDGGLRAHVRIQLRDEAGIALERLRVDETARIDAVLQVERMAAQAARIDRAQQRHADADAAHARREHGALHAVRQPRDDVEQRLLERAAQRVARSAVGRRVHEVVAGCVRCEAGNAHINTSRARARAAIVQVDYDNARTRVHGWRCGEWT